MQKDLERLQGTWRITALEVDGRALPMAGGRIVIEGEHFTTVAMGATYEGTLKLDAMKTPRRFDLIFEAGPEKGNRSLGIYELDGDRWRICLTTTGKNRPTKFATEPGSGHALETLVRESAASPRPPAARPRPPAKGAKTEASDLEGEWSMVSGSMAGIPLDPVFVRSARRVTRGNETTVLMGKQVVMLATFTLDSTKTPRALDHACREGMNAGQTQQGIYRLEEKDGEKTLTTCFSPPGQDRPGEFTSTPDDGRMLAVWRLVKR